MTHKMHFKSIALRKFNVNIKNITVISKLVRKIIPRYKTESIKGSLEAANVSAFILYPQDL